MKKRVGKWAVVINDEKAAGPFTRHEAGQHFIDEGFKRRVFDASMTLLLVTVPECERRGLEPKRMKFTEDGMGHEEVGQ